ncbi:MAG: VOC family protein [Urechidicola sp.]|nr:VOC family protein [Urechidicola sp.]
MKIEELILFTQNLKAQIDFYSKVLEFEMIDCNESSCSFNTGSSMLTFKVKEDSKPYHFAFNIPSNKEKEALHWLKERVTLIPFEEDEIIDFESWNAKALYFYDSDMNIVEFIARKSLNINSSNAFSFKSILNISEMALASTNIKETVAVLNSIKPIKKYSGDYNRFCALGDEEGLFILANPLLKKWFPTDDEIEVSDFIIKGDFNFEFKNGKFIELT